MGGRGSSSTTSQFLASFDSYLGKIAEKGKIGGSYRTRIMAENAETMRSMLGSKKLDELNTDYKVAKISQTAGRASSYDLDDFLNGNNRPLQLSSNQFQELQNDIKSLISRGATTKEISAVIAFGDLYKKVKM